MFTAKTLSSIIPEPSCCCTYTALKPHSKNEVPVGKAGLHLLGWFSPMYPSRVRREYSLHMGSGWAENPICLHIWDIILRRNWMNTPKTHYTDDDWNWLYRLGPLYTYPSLQKKTKQNKRHSFHCTISYRNTCLEKESHFLSPYQAYKRKKKKYRFLLENKQQKSCKKASCCGGLGTAQHSNMLRNIHCTPCYLCCSSFFSFLSCSHLIFLTDKIVSFHLFTSFGTLAASAQLMPSSNLFFS